MTAEPTEHPFSVCWYCPAMDELLQQMPIAATLGAAKIGSTWRELGNVENLDLDFDLDT
ncbi:hypothetical protein [Arthrobacter globiformis]|uniref:hypothetical protein n=1 Tax=Arthrobacter globiformis TaxID=1665 RepID=UPI00167E075A|nr:hypothetical protein [Arthrobacter globiformis]